MSEMEEIQFGLLSVLEILEVWRVSRKQESSSSFTAAKLSRGMTAEEACISFM